MTSLSKGTRGVGVGDWRLNGLVLVNKYETSGSKICFMSFMDSTIKISPYLYDDLCDE